MPVTFEEGAPAASEGSPGPQSGGRRGTGRWWVLIMAGVIVAVGVGAALTRGTEDSRNPAGRQPAATTTATAVAALARGDAAVGEGGTRTLHGVSVGYQQTLTGAVQAALNYDVASASNAMFVKETRRAINAYIYTPAGQATVAISDKIALAVEKQYGLNDRGQVLNKDGTISTSSRLYAGCLPRYGAYKIVSADNPNQPTKVVVQLWRPCLFGPGSEEDRTKVTVQWDGSIDTLEWVEGDWRVSTSTGWSEKPPHPANIRLVNPTFAERAQLLGRGWLLPANATEYNDPSLELGEEQTP